MAHPHSKRRIADINLAWTPDVSILGGARCFVEGGPIWGEVRDADLLLASRDRVALDVAGIRALQALGSKRLAGLDPWSHATIRTAAEHGLGVSSEARVAVEDVA